MAYGDGGFYFLNPVGHGQGYAGDGCGYGVTKKVRRMKKASVNQALSAKFKAHPKTTYYKVTVLLRPKTLRVKGMSAEQFYKQERALFEYGVRLAQETLDKFLSDPRAKAIAGIRRRYYNTSLRYLDSLWAKTQEKYKAVEAAASALATKAATQREKQELEARIKELEKQLAASEQASKDEVVAEDKATGAEAAAVDDEAAAEAADEEVEVEEEVVVETAPAEVTKFTPASEAKTVSTDKAETASDESFVSKYGLYIAGAAVAGGLLYAFRDKLGMGGE